MEVFPILKRALEHRHVHNPEASKSFHAHARGRGAGSGPVASSKGKRLRKTIFGYMRDPTNTSPRAPADAQGAGRQLHGLRGARGAKNYFMTLTRVQYAVLKRWAEGKFEEDWDAARPRPSSPAITAEGLDRAAMENSVGGPFFPGIDCSWMVRKPELYGSPFRVKHSGTAFPTTAKLPIRPGFFSQQMALPWQADFYQCKKQFFPREAHPKYDRRGHVPHVVVRPPAG